MKNSPLKIIIDRLKNESSEKIEETFSPSLIDIHDEEDVLFTKDIFISGKASLVNDHLIIDINIKSTIFVPCSICNENIEVPINIEDFSDVQELSEIKSSIYDFTDEVRSAILLKIPHFIECNFGNCPERKEMQKYLKASHIKEDLVPFSEICKNSFS